MQSEAKFERIRHQRDDAASRFEIDIGDLALPICPRQRAGFPPQHSTHPLRKQILKRGLGLEELSRSTLMELTLTTNTIRGNPRSQLEGAEQGSTTRRHSRRVRAFICGFRGRRERRGAECSGEIEANCGFNATRGTQALSLTDTLPNCWHAFCRNHLRLTSISSNQSHFPIVGCVFHAT